jgi:Protein of unknown function (DUF3237)
MRIIFNKAVILAPLVLLTSGMSPAPYAPAAPQPELEYAFTATVEVAPPVELGEVSGGRQRFIAITGGTVSGPMLNGAVLPGGGDWQTIEAGGFTRLEARYFLRADDGTTIGVANIGVRTASPEVIEQLAKGQDVDPSAYYFRTTPVFTVTDGPHAWMRRHTFVARGVRRPDTVKVDFYVVR